MMTIQEYERSHEMKLKDLEFETTNRHLLQMISDVRGTCAADVFKMKSNRSLLRPMKLDAN